MKFLDKIKQPLITAVIVFVCLQFLASMIRPLLPWLLGAIAFYFFARILINRRSGL